MLRLPFTPLAIRAATLIGCALSFSPTAAAARTRIQVPPSLDARPAAASWTREPGTARAPRTPAVGHPAIHRAAEAMGRKLFPRAADDLAEARARRDAMNRHPAGKGSTGKGRPVAERSCERHVVLKGETLWEIADRAPTKGADEIAERVEAIHRANLRTIGPDPDLILPGQVLSLPDGCRR